MSPSRRLPPVLLAALLAAGPAAAQQTQPERWYQVEVLLFLNTTAGRVTLEDFSRPPEEPDLSDTITAAPVPEEAMGLVPFQLLAPHELELRETFDKLQASGHYRPLLHMAWRQPYREGEADSPAVRIEAPLEIPEPVDPLAPPPAGTLTAQPPPGLTLGIPAAEAAAPAETEPPRAGIEGRVRLRVSRFLHLDMDLVYRERLRLVPEWLRRQPPPGAETGGVVLPTAADGEERPFVSGLMADFAAVVGPQFQNYRLSETRRLRRDEVHYFDHPKFGLIARVSAYEPAPAATAIPAQPVPTPEVPAPAAQPRTSAPTSAPLPVPVINPGKATATPLR